MGHLINPTAFRLGFFRNWNDNWIAVNNIAYAELLHNALTIKHFTRNYISRVAQKKKTISSLIFSHFNLEQRMTNKFALQVYFYDTAVESSYRTLRAACRRIHYKQVDIAHRFFNLHRNLIFRLSRTQVNPFDAERIFYQSMLGKGFFDYLLVRRLIFLFLCAIVKDRAIRTDRGLLIQIKIGLYSLLEYNWRKNLFLKKPLNFFEFFIGVFLQMQFLEKDISPNAIRASFMRLRKRTQFAKAQNVYKYNTDKKSMEIFFLLKWFRFGRMSLINNIYKKAANQQHINLRSYLPGRRLTAPHYSNTFYVKYRALLFFEKEKISKLRAQLMHKRALLKKKRARARQLLYYKNKGITPIESAVKKRVSGVVKYYKHFQRIRHGVSPVSFGRIRSTLTERASEQYLYKMGTLFSWLTEKQLSDLGRFRFAASSAAIKAMRRHINNKEIGAVTLQLSSSLSEKDRRNFGFNLRLNRYKERFLKTKKQTLASAIEPVSSWSLFAYTYIKFSYTLWHTKTKLLAALRSKGAISGKKIFRVMSHGFASNAVWANQLFLDFYRIFFARVRYLYSFGVVKLVLETELNTFSLFPVTVDFFGMDNDLVTASFISFYLARKFLQNFKIRDLFGPVGADLSRVARDTPFLIGYKLQFVGRLTRRDRLRTSWVMGGVVPLSTMTASIDYSQDFSILRNGMCSIKVWLYRPPFFGNAKRNFLFKVVY